MAGRVAGELELELGGRSVEYRPESERHAMLRSTTVALLNSVSRLQQTRKEAERNGEKLHAVLKELGRILRWGLGRSVASPGQFHAGWPKVTNGEELAGLGGGF